MSKLVPGLGALVAFAHHRWNIPVVAELHRSSGAKFVTLSNRLQPGRASLSASLKYLTRLGLVRRNTGYGHPMRPEYLLTPKGQEIGPDCRTLVDLMRRRDEEQCAFSKWSLPVLAAIGKKTLRYGEIRTRLPGSSPRAIALALKTLQSKGWVDRIIASEFPLAAGYRLRPKSRRVFQILAGICDALA